MVAPGGAAESVPTKVAGDSAGLLASEWPSGLDSLLSVPKGVAPVKLPVFSAAARVADQINSTVNVFLHRVGNWLAGLPGNSITTFLEGALLMVRRTLFNQAPNVTPVQEVSTSELIGGSLEAVDPDADTLRYAVVTAPEFGEVVVDEYGDYLYTPGADYAGSDSFVVKVSTDRVGVNLLDPFGDGSTVVKVLVGDDAPTNPYEGEDSDPIDASLYLADAAGAINLARGSGLAGLAGQIAVTVNHAGLSPEDPVMMVSAEGWVNDPSDITVGEILVPAGDNSYWDEFAASAELSWNGVTLGLNFTQPDAEGNPTEYTLILDNVRVDQGGAGQYVLSGTLSGNPEFDVIGESYQPTYQNFMDTYAKPSQISFSEAKLFLDSYNSVSYANQLVGDTGLSAADLGIGGPDAASSSSWQTNSPKPIASVNYGGKFVMGFADGSVKQWTDSGWKILQPYTPGVSNSNWNSPVRSMITYGDGFVVGLGNGSVQQWVSQPTNADPNAGFWNELKCGNCGGWESPVTSMLALQNGQGLDDRLVVGLVNGSVQQWSNRDSQWTEFKCGNCGGWDSAVVGMTARPSPGSGYGDLTFLGYVVLANGSVQRFNGIRTGEPPSWNELQCGYCGGPTANDGASAVLAYKAFSDKSQLVVAYQGINGSASPSRAITSWGFGGTNSKDNPSAGGGWGQSVSTMVAYQDGIAIGLGTGDQPGAVQFWRPGVGWTELKGTDWKSAVESMVVSDDGVTLTVGLNNGSIQQWDGDRWNELRCGYCSDAWNSPVEVMLADGFADEAGDQVVIGLQDGRVEKWVPPVEGTTLQGNWQELNPKKVEVLNEKNIQNAVEWAFDGKKATDPGAPIFSMREFRPACGNSCDGTFYDVGFYSSEPAKLLSKTVSLGDNGQTLEVSYDVKYAVIGYGYVPPGVWDKLVLSEYAGVFMLALPTGPSVTISGVRDEFSTGEFPLGSFSKAFPVGYGAFELSGDVTAEVTMNLDFAEGFDKDSLSAHAYFVPGVLMTFNTNAFSGIQFGFSNYTDTDFQDFQALEGVVVKPEITPTVTGTYGLLIPKSTPIIGGFSLAEASLGYTNPVNVTLTLKKGQDPDLVFGSSGTLSYGVGILKSLTDSLSFGDDLDVYNYESPNLWPDSKPTPV